jgi:outer membrane protein assembly factor BamE (lipoprotein component of BamABCDE complex)
MRGSLKTGRKLMKLLALVLVALLLGRCVYSQIGNRFDISKINQLQPGISTEQDAIRLFGQPVSTTTNPQNDHQLLIWSYAYGTALATGGRAKLAISFDANGKMLKIIQEAKV